MPIETYDQDFAGVNIFHALPSRTEREIHTLIMAYNAMAYNAIIANMDFSIINIIATKSTIGKVLNEPVLKPRALKPFVFKSAGTIRSSLPFKSNRKAQVPKNNKRAKNNKNNNSSMYHC